MLGNPKSSVPGGNIWKDSAFDAARLAEKFIHQEEQSLKLSELLPGVQPEYERNGPSSTLLVTETGSDVLSFSDSGSALSRAPTFALSGTSYMCRVVGRKVYLWDILDKSGLRACELVTRRFVVVSVGVAESDADSASPYWLVVATQFDVSLYYFNPDTITADTPPGLSGFVAPTGGALITCIAPPNKLRRTILGAEDGSVFELIYSVKKEGEKNTSWFSESLLFGKGGMATRCFLSIINRPFSSMLPASLYSFLNIGWGRARRVEVDTHRGIIQVLYGAGNLAVFSLEGGRLRAELGENQVKEALRANNSLNIVDLIPVHPQVGGDVICVLITSGGARVYIKLVSEEHISVACVRNPPGSNLDVFQAVSPDSGRTFVFACKDSSLCVISLDESSRGKAMRERYSTINTGNQDLIKILTFFHDFNPPIALAPLAVSPALLPVSRDPLIGGLAHSWRVCGISSEREITISPKSGGEQLVDILRTKNLHAIRDFSIQWTPEQLSALLLEYLLALEQSAETAETAERILFSVETAGALGLVEAPGLLAELSTAPLKVGPLGAALQSETSHVSSRSRGIAIMFSRIMRPFWFKKAFTLHATTAATHDNNNQFVVVKSSFTAAQRQYICSLVKPALALITRFRHQLSHGWESKLVEGFIVLGNAILETMELMRLLETAQLLLNKRNEQPLSSPVELYIFEQIDNLVFRDVVLGEPLIVELLSRDPIDMQLARKLCPLILSSI